MDRAAMLAELRELIDDSTDTHRFWSDSRLLAYLSEGQDKFCELTGYFRDSSSFTLTLESGVAVYPTPDRTIEILDIFNGSKVLGKVLTGETYDASTWDSLEFSPQSGMPVQWRTDLDTGIISVFPTPGADEDGSVLKLRVWRYSVYDLAGDGAEPDVPAAPEIPSRFHRACVEWAAYKAFNHHDAETQDPVKATEHRQFFMDYVHDGRAAFDRTHNVEVRITSNPEYRA